MKDCRKHSGGETTGDVWVVCKRIKVQKWSFSSYNGEINSVWSTSHCIWMGYKRFPYLLEALECALLLKKQRYGRMCLGLILIVLFSFGPSLLLKLCQSSYCPPYFYLVSPFLLLYVNLLLIPLTFFSCCLGSFANSEVLVYHFKCFKLPLGPSPPLVLGDLFWKPVSPLQHPTSEAKRWADLAHDGQLWQKSVLEEEEGKMGWGWGNWKW